MKQQEIRRNEGENDKETEQEETKNTTKTAMILWRFLLGIFRYRAGDFKDLGHVWTTN